MNIVQFHSDLTKLIEVLPPKITKNIPEKSKLFDVIELVLDYGRLPEIRHGNHEIEYLVARKEIEYTNIDRENSSFQLPDEDNGGLIATIRKAGAVVLQREWKDIEVGGTKIRIGAAFEDMYSLDENNPSATMQTGMYSFLTDFQGTDALTIYMAHRPSSFLLRNGTSLWDIDIVMSGHEHGGQVVLPSLGGLFSRERGFFPDYTHGTFAFGSTTMVVTSGLGSDDEFLPRFNNPPEMVLITVQ